MSAVEGMLKMMTDTSARGLRLAGRQPRADHGCRRVAAGCVEPAADAPGDPAADRPDHSRARAPPPAAGNQRRIRSRVAERRVQGHDPAQRIGDRREHRARSERRVHGARVQRRRERRAPVRRLRRRCACAPVAPVAPARRHRRHPLTVGRSTGAPADRSPVPPDGRGEGVRPASVVGHAAARSARTARSSRSRPDAAPITPRRKSVALLDPITPEPNRDEFAQPQRHRLRLRDQGPRRASAPTCSSIARAAAPCSASSRRRS